MALGVRPPAYTRPQPRYTANVTSRQATPAKPFAQQVHGKPPPSAPRPNTVQGNPRAGQTYRVLKAPGGSWHIYPNGSKVFVRAASQPPQTIAGTPGQIQDPGGQLTPDAQYFDERAAGLFKIRQQLDENAEEGTRNEIQLREALRQMEVQRPRDETNYRQASNAKGLFYSSQLTGNLADLAAQYASRQASHRTDFADREAARLRQRQAIEAGHTLEGDAQLEQAGGRQIERDTDAADAGALVNENPVGGTAARVIGGKVAPPVRYKTSYNKAGQEVHTYSTGRRVTLKNRYRRRTR